MQLHEYLTLAQDVEVTVHRLTLLSVYQGLHEPQGQSGALKVKISAPAGNRTPIVGRPSLSLVTVTTELHRKSNAFRLHNQHQQTP
jgi:hypothetical protein